ncbi:MAG: hypothetical protein M1834_002610 [Cirrosporium novae-zelandiae]|nr:MAG: hypothetical protein M1834_002610 [Cirrosporium novae-zelandiae]
MNPPQSCDVLIVGGGNAGFCAALAAAEEAGNNRKNILLIDKCPLTWEGGNTYFTAGAFRTTHCGIEDLLPLVNNVDEALVDRIDMKSYSREEFLGDLERVTGGRGDARLGEMMVEESNGTVRWLAGKGVRFQLSFNRQAYEVDGRIRFWGGLALKTEDGGRGLIRDYLAAVKSHGVEIQYLTAAKSLVVDEKSGAITSLLVDHDGREELIRCKAVVLAAGGFEASSRLRRKYLGEGWDLARVRGTPYNTGDCLEMAIRDVSARTAGLEGSGCHSVAWDANAPAQCGDREIGNEFTKSGYPLGVMINVDGERFVDEGVDLRNYTYAKFGRAILEQPEHVAFQIWDSKTMSWLRDEEYRDGIVQKITADSISELADKCCQHGLRDREKLIQTIDGFNNAVQASRLENSNMIWNPAIKDGLSTLSSDSNTNLKISKSNWALAIDEPPFLAIKVSCGITFTFGGLVINPATACVISTTGKEISGLFCAGEMVGGLFHGNYPGGSGLMSGSVFGRRAGREAAKLVLRGSPE